MTITRRKDMPSTGTDGVVIHRRNSCTEAHQPFLQRVVCLLILGSRMRRKSKHVPTPAEIGPSNPQLRGSLFIKLIKTTNTMNTMDGAFANNSTRGIVMEPDYRI
ncbi:MAG: hypothetical protein CMJ39_00420 [Phycisphaerae bacterium]|nr:hypothetical protein [Phycisphaerae bacterium]